MDYFWAASENINSYAVPANQLLEYVDTEDRFYLIVGTESGHVRPHGKPKGTKEILHIILEHWVRFL